MKKLSYLLSTLMLAFLLSNCVTTNKNNNTSDEKPATETEDEDMKKNKSTKIATYEIDSKGIAIMSKKISLRIVRVQESRCPAGTNCFVAGEAKITMEISGGGKTVEETLVAKGLCEGDQGNCGNSVVFEGTTIQLLNLYPSPQGDQPGQIPLENYIAKVSL